MPRRLRLDRSFERRRRKALRKQALMMKDEQNKTTPTLGTNINGLVHKITNAESCQWHREKKKLNQTQQQQQAVITPVGLGRIKVRKPNKINYDYTIMQNNTESNDAEQLHMIYGFNMGSIVPVMNYVQIKEEPLGEYCYESESAQPVNEQNITIEAIDQANCEELILKIKSEPEFIIND